MQYLLTNTVINLDETKIKINQKIFSNQEQYLLRFRYGIKIHGTVINYWHIML